MVAVRYTRNLFLRTLCIVYLTAFLSFYNQIPGLYGDDGVLPARSVLENSKHKTLSAKVHYQPTLLWLAPYLGLDINYALDVLALLGAFLAFTGFISQKFCTIPLFAGLWSLFFSLFQVGQVFVKNGCDELLLEAGFLAIFVAPLLPSRRKFSKDAPGDLISMWLVKWLLFRYLLTTGLTKLISGCPSWWGLTALSRYLEVVPLPTQLTWYAFHLPEWVLKLVQVFVNVCEIGLPFLFFLPIRSVRVTAFFIQFFLQLCITLTGNFGYSGILMMALCLSVLDDQFFYRRRSMSKWSLAGKLANVLIHGAVVYLAVQLYSLNFVDGRIESNIAFTKSQFDSVLSRALTYTIYFGAVALLMTVSTALTIAARDYNSLYATMSVFFYSSIAILIFCSSTVPLASLHSTSNATVFRQLRTTYDRLHKLHIVNQYGDQFSKLPAGSGRSEIVFEAAKNAEGPWHEIHFLFKPGNVNATPTIIAPHSPRLDYQMYSAAYSTYDQQPWMLSFVHKLLTQNINVLPLIDFRTSALSSLNPKYVRAVLYNYRYTPWSKRNQNAWWTRQKTGEYLPAYSKDSQYLMDYLRARNLLRTTSKVEAHEYWVRILSFIRFIVGHFEATLIYWSVVSAGFAIICTSASSANVRISSRSNKS